jgi:hypothetical protein
MGRMSRFGSAPECGHTVRGNGGDPLAASAS